MEEYMPRVLVVDDHAFIRRGVNSILQSFPEWELCAEAENGQEAVRLADELRPEVIIMDVSMPVLNGIEATKLISRSHPEIKIVLLTLHDSAELLRSGFRAGARGYLLKSDAEQELLKALRVVVGEGSYISPRIDGKLIKSVVEELQIKH
jgi:DNA-binding NarL/FixJ family response regulator